MKSRQQHKQEEEEAEQSLVPGLPSDVALDCIARIPHRSHSAIRPVCKQWSDLLSAPSFRRRRRQISVAEDLVFLLQAAQPRADPKPSPLPPASYSLTLFNATLSTWHHIPTTDPIPIFAQLAAVDDKQLLLLIGGWDPSTLDPVPDVRILDLATMAWRAGRPMSTPRSFFACAAAGGRVYVAGGHDAGKNALRSAEAYNVDADEWESLPAMAEERDEARGVAIRGDQFWAVSGYGTESQGRFAASAERYDAEARRWTLEEGVWDDDTCAASCFGFGDAMWSVDSSGVRVHEMKEWRPVGPAPPEGVRLSTCAAAVIGGGERVFVTGDVNGGWVVDLRTRKWVRAEAPVGFSGSVYSAAAVRI